MKKQYEKPRISVDMFEANEYIAACYKIKCNVPYGTGYIEKNNVKGYQDGEDEYIASGSGCGVWHVGVQLDAPPTENAMWDPVTLGDITNPGNDAYGVFHWIDGEGNSGHHFSRVTDAEWDTNPNAS